MLTGEVSSIYKKDGKVRKVHTILHFPDTESARKVRQKLARLGNIESDGRPILGVDSRDILEMVLESDPRSFLIPAHIWTPWFSVLGSKSGFDSIEECYGDLSKEIFALETGLSSDPPMNRCCSFLDRYRLVSSSDAHSPEKLGREATLFRGEPCYDELLHSLKTGKNYAGTVEFFPQEGKYHYDGHRSCGVRMDPMETLERGGLCPRCEKPVTRGVLYRVTELADRPLDEARSETFYSITQLPDLLAELLDVKNPRSKKVTEQYHYLVSRFGSEFNLLLFAPLEEVEDTSGPLLREAIRRLRQGEVQVRAGYDGEFGRVKVFREGEQRQFGPASFGSSSGKGPVKAV
jgi:uncharacterized protein (TIGR00375 family)